MILSAHPECEKCSLHAGREHPGVATRLLMGPGSAAKAVLLIGKSPGVEEDREGRAFCGQAGRFAEGVYADTIREGGLDIDVWGTNAVRCRMPSKDAKPTKQHLNACRDWLLEDLEYLVNRYSEVVILLAGAEAFGSVWTSKGKRPSFANWEQGIKLPLGSHTVACFATYNPFILAPGRDPSKATAIEGHLNLLRDYLQHGRITTEIEIPSVDRVSLPPLGVGVLSFDIETYGYVEGFPEQRFFDPEKCITWDGVAPGDLVQCAAVSWRELSSPDLISSDSKPTSVIRHRFVSASEPDRQALLEALRRARAIVGHNLNFDLRTTCAWDHRFERWLHEERPLLIDTAVLNFLQNDQRPERSLKNLSLLFNLYDYGEEEVSIKRGERYPSADDPRLAHYNSVDAVATLRLEEILQERIKEIDPSGDKGGQACLEWYSDLMYLCQDLTKRGVYYDRAKLEEIHRNYSARMERLCRYVQRCFGGALAGKGANKYKEKLAAEVASECDLIGDSRLKRTDTGNISRAEENINLFLGFVPRGPRRKELCAIRTYGKLAKLNDTYLRRLLNKPKDQKPLTLKKTLDSAIFPDGSVHPRWFPVPAQVSSDDSGGTQQVRITCKGPALQTQPPVIERAQVSRFPGGCLLHIDLSQIELRVAAMYSHDMEMLRDYLTKGGNRHASTASLVAGFAVDPDLHPQWYHAGKTLNFLTLFSGGASKFRETLLREVGLDLPLEKCAAIIRAFDEKHRKFRQWQQTEVEKAIRLGRSQLPLYGISRTFLGGRDSILRTYTPTICNFPIQATAAMLALSAQVASEKWLRSAGLETILVSNTYDEGIYDVPQDELTKVIEPLKAIYREPPVYKLLISKGLYPCPIDCKHSISGRNPLGVDPPELMCYNPHEGDPHA